MTCQSWRVEFNIFYQNLHPTTVEVWKKIGTHDPRRSRNPHELSEVKIPPHSSFHFFRHTSLTCVWQNFIFYSSYQLYPEMWPFSNWEFIVRACPSSWRNSLIGKQIRELIFCAGSNPWNPVHACCFDHTAWRSCGWWPYKMAVSHTKWLSPI